MLARFLKRKRADRGISPEELAASCRSVAPGVQGFTNGQSIRFWETNFQNRQPSLGQYQVLAMALGLTEDDVLYGLWLALRLLVQDRPDGQRRPMRSNHLNPRPPNGLKGPPDGD